GHAEDCQGGQTGPHSEKSSPRRLELGQTYSRRPIRDGPRKRRGGEAPCNVLRSGVSRAKFDRETIRLMLPAPILMSRACMEQSECRKRPSYGTPTVAVTRRRPLHSSRVPSARSRTAP